MDGKVICEYFLTTGMDINTSISYQQRQPRNIASHRLRKAYLSQALVAPFTNMV